jgi:hypothetical protein
MRWAKPMATQNPILAVIFGANIDMKNSANWWDIRRLNRQNADLCQSVFILSAEYSTGSC